MLIGVLTTTLLGILCHQVHWQPAPYNLSAIKATAFHLDISAALHIGAFEIIFVFLFVDLFDNIGTLVAVTDRAGLIARSGPEAHTIPRLNRIFLADATSTILGSLTGTSTVTSYIESSAGVAAKGFFIYCAGGRVRQAWRARTRVMSSGCSSAPIQASSASIT
jgi:AGZA family xanthine/uracil permease-like MFS transporter